MSRGRETRNFRKGGDERGGSKSKGGKEREKVRTSERRQVVRKRRGKHEE